MTRSIFDPNSGETERSGSRSLGADAEQISQMPPEATSGEETDADEDATMDLSPNEVADLTAPPSSDGQKPLDPPAKP